MKFLLSKGANVNAPDRDNIAPLHEAISLKNGSEEIVNVLLKNDAVVNVRNKWGKSPLHIAADQTDYDNTAVVNLLLENNADVDAKDEEGETPLMHAVSSNNVKVTELLLEAG